MATGVFGMPLTKRELRDLECAANPLPGDAWHEMFNAVILVVEVHREFLIIAQKRESVDANHYRFVTDPDSLEIVSREKFAKMLRYSLHGGNDRLAYSCWRTGKA